MNFDRSRPARDRPRPKTKAFRHSRPTNTGKTHYGWNGCASPIRRDRSAAAAAGAWNSTRSWSRRPEATRWRSTGEEKIKPPNPRYWCPRWRPCRATVRGVRSENRNRQPNTDQRPGSAITTDLIRRGADETLIGSRRRWLPIIRGSRWRADPGAPAARRCRSPAIAISACPRRSANRRLFGRGGSRRRRFAIGGAVVLGAPAHATRRSTCSRTATSTTRRHRRRHGLNPDVDHIASPPTAVDGRQFRRLNPRLNLDRLPGRAGRHLRDGNVRHVVGPMPPAVREDLVEQLEDHASTR